MDYKERAIQAKKGNALVVQGIFPNEVLETIKDKRLRSDLSNNIFYPSGAPRFNEISDREKSDRARRLKVELAFVRYMSSFETMRYASLLLLFFGMITIFYWTVYLNENLDHGIVTVIEAIALLTVSIKNGFIIRHYKSILFVFTSLFIAELLILQLPNPFLSGTTMEWYTDRRSTIGILFNELSPFIYVMWKLMILGFVAMTYIRINKFIEEKKKYEN